MFNRTVLVAPTHRVTEHVHVTHKHAPTDESVRLLKEFEERAAAKVLDAVKVSNSTFECVIHSQRDFASGDIELAAIFSLNGTKMRVDHRAQDDTPPQKMATDLCTKVAGRIASEVLAPAFERLAATDLMFRARRKGDG